MTCQRFACKSSTTGVTSRSGTIPEHMTSYPVFSEFPVDQASAFCLYFSG